MYFPRIRYLSLAYQRAATVVPMHSFLFDLLPGILSETIIFGTTMVLCWRFPTKRLTIFYSKRLFRDNRNPGKVIISSDKFN